MPSTQRRRGFPIYHIHRRNQRHEQSVSERCLERGSPNHSSMHSNLSVNSKPKMLLMIKWRSSISEGLVGLFPVAVTHGLKLGCSWSRQTNSEESDPTHQRPSSTNSFHGPHEVEPTQTCTYKSRQRQVCTTGIPCGSIPPKEGGFVQDLAKPRKMSPFLFSKKTRPISNKKPMEL